MAEDTIASLAELRAALEEDRDRILDEIASIDRVIALIQARDGTRRNDDADRQRKDRTPDSKEPISERHLLDNDELTEAMILDAIAEAGSTGLAPQKLRNDLNLDQQRFKAFVGKLLAAKKIYRIGERGPGVRYALSKSLFLTQTNGAVLSPASEQREM
jgi:hypothetical protein